jgi:CubicO group peptidase (beta-lactamase class C family)
MDSKNCSCMVMNWRKFALILRQHIKIRPQLSLVAISLLSIPGTLQQPAQGALSPLQTVRHPLRCPTCLAKRDDKISENYQKAGDYSQKQGGDVLMILRGDRIVYEAYSPGMSASTPHILTSGTKSFLGPLAIAAAQDDLLDLDEPVSRSITVWKKDPSKANITIRQLLNLTSGLSSGKMAVVPTYTQAVQSPLLHQPGQEFQYGPIPFQVFGELLKRKLRESKEDPLDYLKRRVLNPIGVTITDWKRSTDGNWNFATGASLSAQDWAKYGQFLEQKGRFDGKKILDKRSFDRELLKSSDANPAYALTLWINEPGVSPKGKSRNYLRAAPADAFMAAGAGGQRLYVIPSEDLVIVRFGRDERFEDNAFLSLLFGKKAE